MRTLRNITMAAAILFAGNLFAQEAAATAEDATVAKATEQTAELTTLLKLDDKQQQEVQKIYTAVNRQEAALNKRAEANPDKIDQAYVDKNIHSTLVRELQKVLSPEQYEQWKLSLKK